MIKNIKNLSFTFSSRAFLSVVPTVVPFGIQEFTFFRSLTTFLTTLENRVTILTLEFYLQKVKLFNSFLCKTTYSELLKELIYYYTNILSLFKLKPLKLLVFDYIRQPKADLMSDSSPTTRVRGFLRQKT